MNNPYNAPNAEMAGFQQDDGSYTPSMFALSGRIGRLRYLSYSMGAALLGMFIIGILSAVLIGASHDHEAAGGAAMILMIICYIPMVAIGFVYARRRLNDTDNTGWLSLLMIIPFIGALLWLYMVFAPGSSGNNKYGPAPGPNNGLIILGALILPIIAVVGILAAVAIPAYQDYVKKAHAAQIQQPQQPQQDSQ